MKFKQLSALFEDLEKTASRLEMTSKIALFFKESKPDSFFKTVYLLQGKLGPDYRRPEIGMGEKLVIKSIAYTTGYSLQIIEKEFQKSGDLGETAEKFTSTKKQGSLFSTQLTVDKVFDNLIKISELQGKGVVDQKIKLVSELLNSASPIQAKFIARLPLDKLRLGAGDPTLMDALAICYLDEFREANKKIVKKLEKEYKKEEDIERQLKFKLREKIESKFNVNPDLGLIAQNLKEHGLKGLDKIDIVVGTPIRPTLAERLESPEKIIKKIGTCQVEAKYDGLRVQIHKNLDKITIYSRRQEDMTKMFPDVAKTVLGKVKTKTAILEAEILSINPKTEENLPFQTTVQRKRKHDVKEFALKYPVKIFVFDLLYKNGKSLLEKPFKERRKILEELIPKEKFIAPTTAIEAKSGKDIFDFFTWALKKNLEGIIAKDLNEKYIAGARKFAWIKLKKSYGQGQALDTIDCAVIGYYSGKGKRTQFGLGTLLVAVYNSDSQMFESVAKIGTGMKEEDLQELEEILSKLKSLKKPLNVISGLNPDFWVTPELVIEVNYDEITKSPLHLAAKTLIGEGLALRFPRMVKIRNDKSSEQTTTSEELLSLFEMQSN